MSVENKWDGAPVSKYSYESDALGLRKWVIRDGPVFATAHPGPWEHNSRNELTQSKRYNNTDPNSTENADPTYNVRSGYDNAGNEVWFQVFGDPNLPCTFNQLNLRTAIEDPNEPNDPNYPNPPLEEFSYDLDHNLTADGLYNYTYDAENRVIKMVPKGTPSNGDKMYESTYDYLGRRVRQVVKVWDAGDWSDDPNDGAEDRRLVYDWCTRTYPITPLPLGGEGRVRGKTTGISALPRPLPTREGGFGIASTSVCRWWSSTATTRTPCWSSTSGARIRAPTVRAGSLSAARAR